MIIADPFGSWVQGAHEGQQDAIAMRQAQDRTAQENYGLHREAAFDPYKLQQAQQQTEMGGLELGQNRKIYAPGTDIPFHAAEAGLEAKQLQNAEGYGRYGEMFPLQKQLQQYYHATRTPAGLAFPYQDEQGQQHTHLTPYPAYSDPQRIHYQMMQQYQQARVAAQLRGQDLSWEKFMEGHPGAASYGQGDVLSGLPQETQSTPQQTYNLGPSGVNEQQPSFEGSLFPGMK